MSLELKRLERIILNKSYFNKTEPCSLLTLLPESVILKKKERKACLVSTLPEPPIGGPVY